MVLVSYSGREINAKLVYYGPGLSGKTTNLEYIYGSIPQAQRGKMVSMKTKTERTLFFDFLPVNLGELSGFKTRFLLYTVPGQVYYNATRKLVLKGVDAVVFVADSKRGKMDENLESLENLRHNLLEQGVDLDTIPWVMQYNKRDLPDVYTVDELEEVLNPDRVPVFEAVATTGQGVVDTFKGVSRLLLRKLSKDIGAPAPSKQPAPAEHTPAGGDLRRHQATAAPESRQRAESTEYRLEPGYRDERSFQAEPVDYASKLRRGADPQPHRHETMHGSESADYHPETIHETEQPQRRPGAGYETEQPQRRPEAGHYAEQPQRRPEAGYEAEQPQRRPGAGHETEQPQRRPGAGYEAEQHLRRPEAGHETEQPQRRPGAGYEAEQHQRRTEAGYEAEQHQRRPEAGHEVEPARVRTEFRFSAENDGGLRDSAPMTVPLRSETESYIPREAPVDPPRFFEATKPAAFMDKDEPSRLAGPPASAEEDVALGSTHEQERRSVSVGDRLRRWLSRPNGVPFEGVEPVADSETAPSVPVSAPPLDADERPAWVEPLAAEPLVQPAELQVEARTPSSPDPARACPEEHSAECAAPALPRQRKVKPPRPARPREVLVPLELRPEDLEAGIVLKLVMQMPRLQEGEDCDEEDEAA